MTVKLLEPSEPDVVLDQVAKVGTSVLVALDGAGMPVAITKARTASTGSANRSRFMAQDLIRAMTSGTLQPQPGLSCVS